jgi:hypothetical protein
MGTAVMGISGFSNNAPGFTGRNEEWSKVSELVEKLSAAIKQSNEKIPPLNVDHQRGPYDNKRVNHFYLDDSGRFVVPSDSNKPDPARFIRGTAATRGARPADIFTNFYQRSEGNCVTVSAIKAAMMKFGHNPHGIYKKVEKTDTGYDIVMRDSFKLSLTDAELEQGAKGADFGGVNANDVLVNARFLYAVSAKRAQLENNDGRRAEGFAGGMTSLNDGEYPGQALRRLGLRDHVAPATVQALMDGAIGTLASTWHSVAVINGHIDLYGSKQRLSGSGWDDPRHAALKLI